MIVYQMLLIWPQLLISNAKHKMPRERVGRAGGEAVLPIKARVGLLGVNNKIKI